MKYSNIVIGGGGVLGSQIAFQAAFCGFHATIWLRSEGSISRTQPKIDKLKETYLEAIEKMATGEGPWCAGISDEDSFNKEESVKAQKQLKDTLVSLTPLFQHYPYFMSETFSILDCMLAPIFLRLPSMGIHLPPQNCRPILLYMQRIFSRPAFLKSLTLQEKNHYRELLKNI